MIARIRRCLGVAAVALLIVLGSIQLSFAQNAGVGGDGNTRILWKGTDGRIVLYKLSSSLSLISGTSYGPYDQWLPLALAVTTNNNSYVLWQRTDGLTSVWLMDSNMNFVTSTQFGPYLGWLPKHLSADTGGASTLRLSWQETDGAFGIWTLQSNLAVSAATDFGPFYGLLPGDGSGAN